MSRSSSTLKEPVPIGSETRSNAERGLNSQNEKITALKEETSNLQLLERVRDLTTEQMTLHSQMSSLRAQLTEYLMPREPHPILNFAWALCGIILLRIGSLWISRT